MEEVENRSLKEYVSLIHNNMLFIQLGLVEIPFSRTNICVVEIFHGYMKSVVLLVMGKTEEVLGRVMKKTQAHDYIRHAARIQRLCHSMPEGEVFRRTYLPCVCRAS